MSFAEYLTKLVKSRGTNLQQLSYKTRIASSHLSRIASGKRKPPKPAALRILADALDVDYVEMLRAVISGQPFGNVLHIFRQPGISYAV